MSSTISSTNFLLLFYLYYEELKTILITLADTSFIDELNRNIKLCDFIENNTLKMKDKIKEMRQEENNKVKVKNRNRDFR